MNHVPRVSALAGLVQQRLAHRVAVRVGCSPGGSLPRACSGGGVTMTPYYISTFYSVRLRLRGWVLMQWPGSVGVLLYSYDWHYGRRRGRAEGRTDDGRNRATSAHCLRRANSERRTHRQRYVHAVRAIVELWRMGLSPEEIPTQLPHLTLAQVFDALSYYSDHQDQIQAYIERNRVPDDLIDPLVQGS